MYDAEWNLITPNSDVIDTDEEEIDTPDGHEEEDQDDDEETKDEKIARLERQNAKLKANKVKNIVKHKTNGSKLAQEVEELRKIVLADKIAKEESEIKSIYASADVEQVRLLTSKWLSVKQAINALYAEEMTTRSNPYAGWFIGSTTSNPVAAGKQAAAERIKKNLWITK